MNHGDTEDTALHGGEKNERNKIGVNFTTDLSYKERILNPINSLPESFQMEERIGNVISPFPKRGARGDLKLPKKKHKCNG